MTVQGLPVLGRRLAYAWLAAVCVVLLPACSEDSPSGEMLELDAGDSLPDEVSVKVGPAGATVKTRGVTLEIPKDALDKDVIITAKSKGQTAPKNVAEKQVSDVFEFGPKGTSFKKDVTVRFTTEDSEPDEVKDKTVFFTKQDSSEYEKLATTTKGSESSAKVRHFSQGFVGIPFGSGAVVPGADAGDGDGEPSLADGGAPDAEVPAELWTTVKVQTQDRLGKPVAQTWAAFQDGDDPFQLLTSKEPGVYDFEVKSERFAVFFLCKDEKSGSTSGTAFYRATRATTFAVPTLDAYCAQPPADITYVQTARVSLGGLYSWRAGQASWSSGISYSGTTTVDVNYDVSASPTDLLFAAGPEGYNLSRVLVVRGVTGKASTTVAYDLAKDGAAFAPSSTATVIAASAETSLRVVFATGGTHEGLLLDTAIASGESVRTLAFAVVPPALRLAKDRFVLLAAEGNAETQRSLTVESAQPADMYGELPKPLSVSFTSLKTPYARPSYKFERTTSDQEFVFTARFDESRTVLHAYTLEVEAAWFRTSDPLTTEFAFPDLSKVTGFDPRWVNAANAVVASGAAKLLVRSGATEGTRVLRYEAASSGAF